MVCLGFGANAQNPNINRSNHWFFGTHGAGADFTSGSPVADTNGAIMASVEGCTAMSDALGNLLFYTDGLTVWNRLHQQMTPIGTQLGGDASSSQSAIAFPHPTFSSFYYIVTVGDQEGDISWSLVDMSQNGGLGQIVGANAALVKTTSEKLTVTESCDRSNYLAYGLRSTDGIFLPINTAPDSLNLRARNPQCPYMASSFFLGQMKFSPNGNFLTVSGHNFNAGFFLFNDHTGEIYLANHTPIGFFGLEYSPDSKQLFIDDTLGLSNIAIDESFVLSNGYSVNPIGTFASPQLGKDGKIYGLSGTFLSSIGSPNNSSNFNVQLTAIPLFRQSNLSTPSFPASWFAPERFRVCYSGTCPGEEYNFFISGDNTPDAVSWNFGDSLSPNNTASGIFVNHTYHQAGIYMVSAAVTFAGITDTIVKYAFTRESTYSSGIVLDTVICEINPDLGFSPQFPIDHRYGCPTYSDGLEAGVRIFSHGTYFVTWNNGCSASVTDTFHVNKCPVDEPILELPNIITPNYDQINDVISIDMKGLKELRVQIYNRWGEIVQKGIHYNNGSSNSIYLWDGSCWKNPCSDGVYFYVLDYTYLSGNNKQSKGTITVVRGL